MPPKKKGIAKRISAGTKSTSNAPSSTNGDAQFAPPDRNTWPGWVELESEPAYFNAMLKDMGVRGVKVREVYSMDQEILATLPQPVHALIFLFRYRTSLDQQVENGSAPNTDHIWFANQIPDFACASVALLNIVNNIPGLHMGKELRDFKDFTQDLDPRTRGEAIDSFDFVRRIHNSFARDTDLLQADVHFKDKLAAYKRKEAAAKGRATKAAKKAAAESSPLQEKSVNDTVRPTRSTNRSRRAASDATSGAIEDSSVLEIALARSTRKRKSEDLDDDFEPDAKKSKQYSPASASNLNQDADNAIVGAEGDAADGTRSKADASKADKDDEASNAPNGIAKTVNQKDAPLDEVEAKPRRSGRARKPPKSYVAGEEEEVAEPEEGFHFIAYIPVEDHVWKLDGLNYLPEDMGSFGTSAKGADGGSGNWLDVVSPAIMGRMAEFEGQSIEFNLMAVVRDDTIKDRTDLVKNVKALQAVETKLTAIVEDWHELEGGETKPGIINGTSPEFDITQGDIDAIQMPSDREKEITEEEDLLALIDIRKRLLGQQDVLRSGLRNASWDSKDDDDKVRHQRHDYSNFVRKWMGALAENELLGSLIDGAEA